VSAIKPWDFGGLSQSGFRLLVVLINMRDDGVEQPWSWWDIINYRRSKEMPGLVWQRDLGTLEYLGYISRDDGIYLSGIVGV